MHIYNFLPRMADNMTFQNIDLYSWEILDNRMQYKQYHNDLIYSKFIKRSCGLFRVTVPKFAWVFKQHFSQYLPIILIYVEYYRYGIAHSL
jgi:hypothetical protein